MSGWKSHHFLTSAARRVYALKNSQSSFEFCATKILKSCKSSQSLHKPRKKMNQNRQTPSQPHPYEASSSGTRNEIIRPVTEPEDEPCTTIQSSLDLILAVRELHVLSANDLGKLIRDAENGIIKFIKHNGSCFEINMESLVKNLGIHLIAQLLSFKRDEEHLKYMLSGMKLLHTLHILADHDSKVNQFLMDDVQREEKMYDLTFFMIVFISRSGQIYDSSREMVLLHSALLASSLYLLTAFISPQWDVLTAALVSHQKVDIFTRAAFSGALMVTNFLKAKLSAQHTDTRMKSTVDEVHCLFQLSEASLQFLQSLCQQTLFRECLLNNNKELCEEGGVLKLVLDILKLPRCDDSELMAVVYQLKSKALSTMLHLCEVESPSFLNMSSSTSHGLELAKSTVSEVLEVLKMMFHGDLQDHPRGILQLNAMRLIEIFSNDCGFRSYIILNLTEDLAQVFLQPESKFLSAWCSCDDDDDDPAEDIIMDFDSVSAAGHVLGVISTSFAQYYTLSTLQAPQILNASQISALLVKILANLSCSVPGLRQEGESLFAIEFLRCLHMWIPSGDADRTVAAVTGNLNSLLALAGSLAPEYVNADDVNQLREFISHLEQLIAIQESETQQVEGSEVTASQLLTNWLNECRARKRRARAAAKETRVSSGRSGADPAIRYSNLEAGEVVLLIDEHGEEIGRGKIHSSRGVWFENNLVELGLCVVDVTDLIVSKRLTLPYPCDAGSTFAEAELILGRMRILWRTRHILRRL